MLFTSNTCILTGGEVPRLVAVEGEVGSDGSFPIYRHPADESPRLLPWSSTVSLIRTAAEMAVGHPLNHVLIQHYRTGADYISEHSDKTIDVVRGSKIVNVSLGARRVMTLRGKERKGDGTPRTSQKIPLPHNSMFVMGLETNKVWLHGISIDKRPLQLKDQYEAAQGGARISLTFRQIGTFLSADKKCIWGQGARSKTRDEAGNTLKGGDEAGRLLAAFGQENHDPAFDWERSYGDGFDVVHFTVRDQAQAQ